MNSIKFDGQKPMRLGNHISLLQGQLPKNEKTVIGIDPGVNFGMTVINRELVQIYYGKLPTDKRAGIRGIYVYDYITKNSPVAATHVPACVEPWKAVIEGAAYNAFRGQVVLEEVRFAFFIALHHMGYNVSIVPPATIRKSVLGSGKLSMGDEYPRMNHNAADSLGCALYALKGEK